MRALFTWPISDEYKQKFIDTGVDCVFNVNYTKEDIDNADVVFGNPNPEYLKNSHIKWLQLASAGANNYCDIDDSIVLTNASGAYDEAICEYMLGITLAITKKLYGYYNQQLEGVWKSLGKVKSIKDLTIVCVGMGSIGKRYAKLMHSLGAKVYGVNRSIHKKPDYVEKLYTTKDMDKALSIADVVAITLPETKKTYHMFDYDMLHRIKKGAILMNLGRGTLIIEGDLVKVIQEHYLDSVYLDVCEIEPLPKTSKLWKLDNVYITPHITGGPQSDISVKNVEDIFYRNLVHYLNNEELENIVDKKRGY